MSGRGDTAGVRRVTEVPADRRSVDRALAGGHSVTIGDVITLLQPDFPDVTISKIRFLEDQGLVEPDRTPSGYRKFGPGHVDRLRTVLTLQRDHYLPLRVIRDVVAGRAGGSLTAVAPSDAPGEDEGAPGGGGTLAGTAVAAGAARRDQQWLAAAGGAAPSLVAEMIEHGLLDPAREGRWDADDAEAVRAAVALSAHGLGPRHLRPLRAAADREADLVQRAAGSAGPGRGGRDERAAEARREVAAALLRMHAAMVAARLR